MASLFPRYKVGGFRRTVQLYHSLTRFQEQGSNVRFCSCKRTIVMFFFIFRKIHGCGSSSVGGQHLVVFFRVKRKRMLSGHARNNITLDSVFVAKRNPWKVQTVRHWNTLTSIDADIWGHFKWGWGTPFSCFHDDNYYENTRAIYWHDWSGSSIFLVGIVLAYPLKHAWIMPKVGSYFLTVHSRMEPSYRLTSNAATIPGPTQPDSVTI